MKTLLFEEGQVVEVRILNAPHTLSGYYNDFAKMAADALAYSGKGAVYATLNPANPALMARAANRLQAKPKSTTTDADILCRRWLPIDFDPVRPADISSTDTEHEAALARARACRAHLRQEGWPEPILADSGNGAHLLFRIDLPNNAESLKTVENCLKSLAFLFGDDSINVDLTTKNASRIWKLYGTKSVKGDDLPERPHRMSRVVEAPKEVEVVDPELLLLLADSVPVEPPAPPQSYGAGRRPMESFDIDSWIETSGLQVASTGTLQGGGRKWILNPCPWNPAHTNKAAFIIQFPNGAIAAGCRHNGCIDNHWPELRKLVDPSWQPYEERRDDSGYRTSPDAVERRSQPYDRQVEPESDSKVSAASILGPRELAQSYRAFVLSLKERCIHLGWPGLDKVLRGIGPGEVCTVIAKSRVGKSAFLQNALRRVARTGRSASLWCSMEQPSHQVFERYAQMVTGAYGEDIENASADEQRAREISEKVVEELGEWTLTCDTPGLKVADIERAVVLAAEKIGHPINLLAIDYLGLIDGSDLDRTLYGAVSKVVRELKNVAKRHGLAVLLLCQVSRTGGEDGSTPLTINSARESGAIEEAADFLLGLYRPRIGLMEQDDCMSVQVLKNRKGKDGMTFEYEFDRRSMVIKTVEMSTDMREVAVAMQPAKPHFQETDEEVPIF